jgi:hypothetical protein
LTWNNPDPAYEARYPEGWTDLSAAVKRSRQTADGLVQCSCCQRLFEWEDIETHHAAYWGERDQAGANLFPVCGTTSTKGSCHHWLHLKEQWHHDKKDKIWGSGNYQPALDRLQVGYRAWGRQESWASESGDGCLTYLIAVPMVVLGLLALSLVAGADPKPQPATIAPKPAIATPKQQRITPKPGYNAVNVRARPSPTAPIIGTLRSGELVPRSAKQVAGWCAVGPGWVDCSLLSL